RPYSAAAFGIAFAAVALATLLRFAGDMERVRRADCFASKQARFWQLIDTCVKSLSGNKNEQFAPDGYTCTLTFKVATDSRHYLAKVGAAPLTPRGATRPTSEGA